MLKLQFSNKENEDEFKTKILPLLSACKETTDPFDFKWQKTTTNLWP